MTMRLRGCGAILRACAVAAREGRDARLLEVASSLARTATGRC